MMTIIKTPDKHFFTCGDAEGFSRLNSFDNALLEAKIGNTNLVKMSSIVPPHCDEIAPVELPQGALIPVAYAAITSETSGECIAAGIAVAYPDDSECASLIMEFSGVGTKDEIEAQVRSMVVSGMERRGKSIREIKSIACEHIVETIGTAFAACVLWC